jgi:predicted dinucleotide-binding enzyme
MRIAIAGAGRIGATLGRIWAGRGHEVVFTLSRDQAKLSQVAAEIGGETAEPPDAVRSADVVLVAVPGRALAEALQALGPLDGKVVIDATNGGGDEESSGARRRRPRGVRTARDRARVPAGIRPVRVPLRAARRSVVS